MEGLGCLTFPVSPPLSLLFFFFPHFLPFLALVLLLSPPLVLYVRGLGVGTEAPWVVGKVEALWVAVMVEVEVGGRWVVDGMKEARWEVVVVGGVEVEVSWVVERVEGVGVEASWVGVKVEVEAC